MWMVRQLDDGAIGVCEIDSYEVRIGNGKKSAAESKVHLRRERGWRFGQELTHDPERYPPGSEKGQPVRVYPRLCKPGAVGIGASVEKAMLQLERVRWARKN